MNQGKDGRLHCIIHPKVTLELGNGKIGDSLPRHPRIFIDPSRIEPLSEPYRATEPNPLAGRVRQVMAINGRVRLVVDAGVPLTLTLSHQAYRASRAMVGDILHFKIPHDAIEILRAYP
jgi:hypothetical protein